MKMAERYKTKIQSDNNSGPSSLHSEFVSEIIAAHEFAVAVPVAFPVLPGLFGVHATHYFMVFFHVAKDNYTASLIFQAEIRERLYRERCGEVFMIGPREGFVRGYTFFHFHVHLFPRC